jgi:flagellar basal body-associated protein FliL
MTTLLWIVITAVSVVTFAVVAWAFIWAAKKDGEEERAFQNRLGIRRRTRLGR